MHTQLALRRVHAFYNGALIRLQNVYQHNGNSLDLFFEVDNARITAHVKHDCISIDHYLSFDSRFDDFCNVSCDGIHQDGVSFGDVAGKVNTERIHSHLFFLKKGVTYDIPLGPFSKDLAGEVHLLRYYQLVRTGYWKYAKKAFHS